MLHRIIHAAIISHLRTHLTNSALADQIVTWSDDLMLRRIFLNYRGERGLRLTQFGQQLMQCCFQCFEFKNSKGEVPSSHLLFLDSHAKMPYFYNDKLLVIYDPRFAVFLRLVNGELATLVEINLVD